MRVETTGSSAEAEPAVERRVAEYLPRAIELLSSLIEIPSISRGRDHADDVRASAHECARILAEIGLDPRVVDAGGHPSVIARKEGPAGAPTVLLYAHHDVQPVSEGDWHSPAFAPSVREGRLYGRGSADDKAGFLVHVAALAAWADELPVGVALLIDGEEEIGSPTLEGLLERYSDVLDADVLIIADSINWAVDVPGLTTTLRGLVDVAVEVSVLDGPVHSGAYGGVVPDALTTLCALLGTLHTAEGELAVEGLTSVPGEPEAVLEEQSLRDDAHVLDGVALMGSGSIAGRLWWRPSATVTGVDAPSVADAPNALIPSARARISMRIAPNDTPESALAALTSHLERHVRLGARVDVTPLVMAHPSDVLPPADIRSAALGALSDGWGVRAVETGIGGTLPLIRVFENALPGIAILSTGVQDPRTNAHGDDESVDLAGFARSCTAEALLLGRLASVASRRSAAD